jgi:hypothetical protein
MQMKQQIKNKYTNAVIYEHECTDGDLNPLKTAVEAAVKDGAILNGASLDGIKAEFCNW